MLDPIYEAFGSALAFFYAIIPNLGVGIILLTVTVMLILFPLTAKSAKSMLAMQRLQPEIKKLQAKHKGDRQKLNEEMMKLYQEHKVNPLGGCLPLLLQMPVFIALFHVLRNPLSSVPDGSSLFKALEAAKPGGLSFLGMDLSVKATDAHGGFGDALPYYILVALVVLTGFVQSRQTARNTPPGANSQMLIIGKVLPVFFGLISLNFPSGLVLYFFVSNTWRVGQQELIMRKIAPRDHLLAGKGGGKGGDGKSAIDVKSAEATPSGGKEPPELDEGDAPAAPQETPARKAAGGLRALFRPPPPPSPETNGGGAEKPAATAAQSSGSSPPSGGARKPPSSGPSSRAGQSRAQRRRSSNKKRKR
jgi:YidC/Oxa1 family membrane protein insertase